MIPTFLFLFGAVIGSFLNVCVHRLPRGESIVWPGSHCPRCQRPIAPYDNVPIASYLLLGGKCRHCRAPISPRYLLVELATALLFVFLYWRLGLSAEWAKQATLGSLLLVLVITDLQERLLPDRVTFPGMALGLLFSIAVPVGDGAASLLARLGGIYDLSIRTQSVLDALLGALAGGGILYLVGELYFRLRRREGMGLGDVKMMAMVGCFLGPKLTLLTILLGSVAGSVLGLLFILTFRKGTSYELPFGTFLGMAAWFAALYGWRILSWYAGFFP